MIHYKCASCRTILEADDEKRGGEETCPHCGTINIIPGGTTRPHQHQHHVHHHRHHEEEEEEQEKKEPITVGKVLKAVAFALVAGAAFTGLYLFFKWREPLGERATKALVPHLAELATAADLKDATREFRGTYIVGRLAMVNFYTQRDANAYETDHRVQPPHATEKVGETYRGINREEFIKLPESLWARTAEEAEALVWLKWTAEVDPSSTAKDKRFRIICEVSVIDRAAGKLVGRTTIKGGRPPLPDSGIAGAFGTRPTDEIVAYLKGLPRYYRDPWGALVEADAKK